MVKLKLNGTDLLGMENLFPQQGDIKLMVMVKDLRGKIKLSVEEMENMELKSGGGRMTWNKEKAGEMKREVELSGSELTFLKEQVEEKDKAKQVTDTILELCIKIREGGKEGEKGT